jgi:hypothetical protein
MRGGPPSVGQISIADTGSRGWPAAGWVRFRLPGGSDLACRQQAASNCFGSSEARKDRASRTPTIQCPFLRLALSWRRRRPSRRKLRIIRLVADRSCFRACEIFAARSVDVKCASWRALLTMRPRDGRLRETHGFRPSSTCASMTGSSLATMNAIKMPPDKTLDPTSAAAGARG